MFNIKRHISFLTLSLLLLNFFACNLEVPTALDVKGTWTVSLGANFDIGEFLKKERDILLKDMDDKIDAYFSLIPTTQPVRTYIIRMKQEITVNLGEEINNALKEVFKTDSINIEDYLGFFPWSETIDIPLRSDVFTIPKLDFENVFKDYSITPLNAMLYISSSPDNSIGDIFFVNFNVDNNKKDYNGFVTSNLDGYNESTPYPYDTLPPGSLNTHIIYDGINDLDINYTINFILGAKILPGWLDEDIVFTFELVFWFPLELIADEGAVLEFPDNMLMGGKDLFLRSPDAPVRLSDLIEYVKFHIILSDILFVGRGQIVVTSPPNIEYYYPLRSNILEFDINRKRLTDINDLNPFSPNIRIIFNKGTRLRIMRELDLTDIVFTARMNSKVGFDELPWGN